MMKRLFILSLSLIIGFALSAYANNSQPSYPGGEEALRNYLSENIQYPPMAAEMGIEGVVTVEFMVKADGSIGDAKIVRMVDPDLEEEALRVVMNMPRWNPASKDGVPADAWFSFDKLECRTKHIASSVDSARNLAISIASLYHKTT